jgi:hypothetical protein
VGLKQSVVYLFESLSVFGCENNVCDSAYAKFDVAVALLENNYTFSAFWYDIRIADYILRVLFPFGLAGG